MCVAVSVRLSYLCLFVMWNDLHEVEIDLFILHRSSPVIDSEHDWINELFSKRYEYNLHWVLSALIVNDIFEACVRIN